MARTRTPVDDAAPQGADVLVEHDADEAPAFRPVRVLRPVGFVDEFGDTWSWSPGQVVRNPYVLSLLAGRAQVEPVE